MLSLMTWSLVMNRKFPIETTLGTVGLIGAGPALGSALSSAGSAVWNNAERICDIGCRINAVIGSVQCVMSLFAMVYKL